MPEPIEYKVLTDGGFETVTDTVQDAQMVNLEQLASLSGIDPEVYSGWAFGIGLERIVMRRFAVDDMRLFYENDTRFLEQF